MDIFSSLQHADEYLFKLINGAVLLLDGFMLLMRNPLTWIPVYLSCILVLKKGIPIFFLVFMSLLCFGLTDFISSGILV